MIMELLNDLKEFQKHVPLVRCLCNPGLKPRHWDIISNQILKLQVPISSEKEVPLRRLIDMEINQHLAELEEISDSASKEYGIEQIMNKML